MTTKVFDLGDKQVKATLCNHKTSESFVLDDDFGHFEMFRLDRILALRDALNEMFPVEIKS